jgi:chemotaxis protein MotB
MKIINVILVSLSLFMIANTLAAQAVDEGLQAADEISALQKENTALVKVLEEALAINAEFQKRLEETEAVLRQKDREQLSIAAATEKLRADLEQKEAAIRSLIVRLNVQRKKAEETLALLDAAQSVEKTMYDELTTALLSLEAARLMQASSQDELDYYKRRDADNKEKITNLGGELNVALARVVAVSKRNLDLEAAEKQRLEELQTILTALDAAKRAATSAVVFRSRLAESEAQREIVENSFQEELKALKKRDAASQQELQAAFLRLEGLTVALQVAEAEAQADTDDLRSALSKAIAARQTAEQQLTSAEQKAALLVTTAQVELQQAMAISTEAQRKMALLSLEVRELRVALDDSKQRNADYSVKITNLGSELNIALAQVAAEYKRNMDLEAAKKQSLERYKSDFFGSLRGLLEDIEGVSIFGDRFVFSSEVLFASGRAELTAAGRKEISKVANILKDITQEIPQNIDWVLQVDGHTDDQPILAGNQFQNNWELSQARALSVVLYLMTSEQMQPSRLSANGFGEYQPINPANSRVARAQNRRIELKLTER